MKYILEIQNGLKSNYIVEEFTNGTLIDKYSIDYFVKIKLINNRRTYFLYDKNYVFIDSVYEYINFIHLNSSDNTKMRLIYTLRKLFVFKSILNKNFIDWKLHDYIKFKSFLNGSNFDANDFILLINSDLSLQSIKMIIGICKGFFKYLKIIDYKYFDENNRIYNSRNSHYQPKSFNDDDINRIFETIEQTNYSYELMLKIKCIILLMLENGLRIGEVLGLTFEDLKVKKFDNNEKAVIVLIRNRISNSLKQQAKRTLSINSYKQYESKQYNSKDIGYQLTVISINLFNMINEYIDISHERLKKNKNYIKSKADCVDPNLGGTNNYIFLNDSNGSPLCYNSWNKIAKTILIKSGIEIDKVYKKINLSHRFRHTYIMNLLYKYKIPSNTVIHFSRHSNISSLDPYNNLTNIELIFHYENIERLNEVYNDK